MLSAVPLFSGCSKRELAAIAKLAEEVDLPAGHTLIHEEAPIAYSFFVLLEGRGQVRRENRLVATLTPGDVVGELALILRRPRTATVTLTAPSRLLSISAHNFRPLLARSPEIHFKMLEALAERLVPTVETGVGSTVVHTSAGETGRSWWGPGDMYTFLVTGEESGGSMFALDCLVAAGGGPPPHRHLAEDELFTITEGSITFTMGDETRFVPAGQSVFVPRGTRHAYRNEGSTQARMIAVYTPAGMEGWFREVCTPVEDPSGPAPPVTEDLIQRMLKAGPRYNVEWVD